MKAHALAALLLKQPDEEVGMYQQYNGAYTIVNDVTTGPVQDHKGDLEVDEDGKEIILVKLE